MTSTSFSTGLRRASLLAGNQPFLPNDAYYPRGENNANLYKINLTTNTLTTISSYPATLSINNSMANRGSAGYTYRGGSVSWYKTDFATDTTVGQGPNVSISVNGSASQDRQVAGYVTRGNQGTEAFRFPFATEVHVSHSSVPNANDGGSTTDDGVAGYLARGSQTSTMYKFPYPNGTYSTMTAAPDQMQHSKGFQNRNVAGYYHQGFDRSDIMKISFPTDTVSELTTALPSNNHYLTASEDQVKGLLGNPGSTNVYGWLFTTDALTSVVFNLPVTMQDGDAFENS